MTHVNGKMIWNKKGDFFILVLIVGKIVKMQCSIFNGNIIKVTVINVVVCLLWYECNLFSKYRKIQLKMNIFCTHILNQD